MSKRTLAVIGGGAAGIFAALHAAEHNRADNIAIYEASSTLLQKVKISGGGRCNVTNHCFEIQKLIQNYPRGKQFLKRIFYQFQPTDTVKWFSKRQVELKTERDMRMFPTTDSSQTIIDCFLSEIKKHNIEIHYNSRIVGITKEFGSFNIVDSNNKTTTVDSLLLATGSSKTGYKFAQSLGHTIIEPIPSLFTFKIPDTRLKELSGVSCAYVTATIVFGKKQFQQSGPMVVTHWGLSGPAILKLSAFAARELYEQNYKTELSLHFAPDLKQDQIVNLLAQMKQEHKKKNISRHHPFEFPKSIWKSIITYLNISQEALWGELSKKEINRITEQIRNSKFEILGKSVFKDEFVTCGGVSLSEVDPKTMQSKKCENLYLAGEILDIDGITGGFNFQSAWTTGFIAGKNLG